MIDIKYGERRFSAANVITYPMLAKCTNEHGWYIVLFRKAQVGTVVYSEHRNWVVGEAGESFTMSNFVPLPKNEKLVLRNRN